MPVKQEVIYTPFDGRKQHFSSIRQCLNSLDMMSEYPNITQKFRRYRIKGEELVHVWKDGKIEVIEKS